MPFFLCIIYRAQILSGGSHILIFSGLCILFATKGATVVINLFVLPYLFIGRSTYWLRLRRKSQEIFRFAVFNPNSHRKVTRLVKNLCHTFLLFMTDCRIVFVLSQFWFRLVTPLQTQHALGAYENYHQ